MQNLMMDDQLNISMIMEYTEQTSAHVEIVSLLSNGKQHRCTYGDAFQRARKLANALDALQIAEQEPVATLAWNDYRHFELYYAVPCSGRVCHTINPRLFPEQIVYIIGHAKNRIVFLDPQFVPLLEKIHTQLPQLQHYVVLCDADELPQSTLNLISYEALIANQPDTYHWPELDERTPSGLCYTSGTTGNPKGVLYSHRSTVLHTLAGSVPDATNLSGTDVLLPIVPMFHVNAWGVPYSAAIAGCKLVLPGNKAGDGATLSSLINQEKVTYAMGVPTVWLALVNHLESTGVKVPSLQRAVSGGAACPLALIERMSTQGINVEIGWGMTETSPMGSYNRRQPWYAELPTEQYQRQITLAGKQVFGIRLRIVSPEGQVLPRDGKTSGILQARGPWVASGYYGGTPSQDWFDTGDVATIDSRGYVCIVDRTKDVIKSGGEWISSIDVENAVMAHPAVLEAAVIGLPHPAWSERPLLIVVPRESHTVDPSELLEFLKDRIAKWWVPELCLLADTLPHTATGKVSKKDLREQYQHIQWPN